jgi:hydroxylamine reductase
MFNYQTNNMQQSECDECLTKGICSVNPTLTSLQEVILLYLKELSFYILKLKDYGVTNDVIKERVIYALYNIVTDVEYNQEQFHEIISQLYDFIMQSKTLYEKYCLEHDIEIITTKSYFKYSKKFELTDAIKKGEKYFLKKSMTFDQTKKSLFDIMLFLCKSMVIKMVELERLGNDNSHAYYATLELLDALRPGVFSVDLAQEKIKSTIGAYYEIARALHSSHLELYGELEQVEVSFTPLVGKAILVSGSDYKKLENVLKAVENTEINVYTHGVEMLMAHAFPKFNSHPRLKGHFGAGLDSSLIDFASFPGAILMTKGTLQKVEYLYRGRLFTLDPVAPSGVIKIKEGDYSPLIKSALDAKGFVHPQTRPKMKVGYKEEDITKKVNEILDKLEKGEIRHLYIVGLMNLPNLTYKAYFEKLFSIMPKDCYVLSLCCPISTENVYHLDSFFDDSLLYKILRGLAREKHISELPLTVFLTKCDKHTISNLLYLNEIGVKHLYMSKCPPFLINPLTIETLQNMFSVKEIKDPKFDLEETLIE